MSNPGPWVTLCVLFTPHSALAQHPEEQNVPVVGLCTPNSISLSCAWPWPVLSTRQTRVNPVIVPRAQLCPLHTSTLCLACATARYCRLALPWHLHRHCHRVPGACCCTCWRGLCLPRGVGAPPALLPRAGAHAELQEQCGSLQRPGARRTWSLQGSYSAMGPCTVGCVCKAFVRGRLILQPTCHPARACR